MDVIGAFSVGAILAIDASACTAKVTIGNRNFLDDTAQLPRMYGYGSLGSSNPSYDDGREQMGVVEGRERLAIAKRQLEKVQSAAWGEEYEEAVMWAFYAYENCVTAVAALHDMKWPHIHSQKAQLAQQLHLEGFVSIDISDELRRLNDLRKAVAYEQPDPELLEVDLDILAQELEEFIDEIDANVESST